MLPLVSWTSFLEQHLAEAEDRRTLDLQLAKARIDHFAGVELGVDACGTLTCPVSVSTSTSQTTTAGCHSAEP